MYQISSGYVKHSGAKVRGGNKDEKVEAEFLSAADTIKYMGSAVALLSGDGSN